MQTKRYTQYHKVWKWIDGGTTGDRKSNVFVVVTLLLITSAITLSHIL